MLTVPTAVLDRAGRVADAFETFTGVRVDAAELIGGRAALLGRSPAGQVSAGGATRLMRSRDGWCALTLARPDDIAAVPALISADEVDDPWPAVQGWVAENDCADMTERARLLGLPAAGLGETPAEAPRVYPFGAATATRGPESLLVADLSALWAGPLCGRLLASAGATVVKVESAARPDGARHGPQSFFDWMNAGKLSYSVDFDEPSGLRALLAAADVVIESSRPAALVRRGLAPTDVTPRDGRVWLRVTGHGTDGGRENWVAFGDDAAVSGGLVGGEPDEPEFCGDAIADPLTGLEAALAVAQSLRSGGGELIEMSMAAVAATYAELPRDDQSPCAAAPHLSAAASPLGADNEEVERLIEQRRLASC
ncbi:acyl-CoA transferase [Mycolicibacterium novocastrense]|uniref:CoA transferase n=1 Tax=Mycolicibacterium novocastrense TaxID=59813 RepID=UPI00074A1DE1|nr:CoA transferase [Mycolicibacterium novocastrense]KUH66442.1 acyl-CoA transferase [Mycolicibacterium novocastrense]KUH72727.1 acyl-CoA transferase [Mycolicibacterium novocastrense]KUH74974.1 acyl-CoA transferase [Mycolicibacterium novocastrense]